MLVILLLPAGSVAQSVSAAPELHFLLLRPSPTNPADYPVASLVEALLRQELLSIPGARLTPPSRVHALMEKRELSGLSCADWDCMAAMGKLLEAPFVIAGAHHRDPNGDAIRLTLFDAAVGRPRRSVNILFAPSEEMTPKLRAAAAQMAAAASGRSPRSFAGFRAEELKRRGAKDPVKAVLWTLIPGGGLAYAGEPAWGAAYALVESATLGLFIRQQLAGKPGSAFVYGATGASTKMIEFYHAIYATTCYNRTRALTLNADPEGGVRLLWTARF